MVKRPSLLSFQISRVPVLRLKMRTKIGAWGSIPLLAEQHHGVFATAARRSAGRQAPPSYSRPTSRPASKTRKCQRRRLQCALGPGHPEMIKLIRTCPRRLAFANDSQTLIWELTRTQPPQRRHAARALGPVPALACTSPLRGCANLQKFFPGSCSRGCRPGSWPENSVSALAIAHRPGAARRSSPDPRCAPPTGSVMIDIDDAQRLEVLGRDLHAGGGVDGARAGVAPQDRGGRLRRGHRV